MASGGLFRKVRILLLLLVLLFVAANAWLVKLRTTDWNEPLWVAVYPINGDGNGPVAEYMATLTPASFASIEGFFAREASRYGLTIREPVTFKLAPPVSERPPPAPPNSDRLAVMWWSLTMRYWAYRHDTFDGPTPDIKMFVVYHDPDLHSRVDHSVGLQKGLIGVVNAYAHHKDTPRNNVVIAHELLHTVGATDKYDPHSTNPLFPDGFADPELSPLFPQRRAEIMAGRIPLDRDTSRMPAGLDEVIVGPSTAREIRWAQ